VRSRFQHIDVIDDRVAAILRQKTDAERMAIGFRMWQYARDMLQAEVVHEQPHLTEAEIQREVARRISQPDFEEECYSKIPLSLFL
jgi:Rv0078B-related antitoxin